MARVKFKQPVTVGEVREFYESLPWEWARLVEWRSFVLIDPDGHYTGPRVTRGDQVLVLPGGWILGQPVVPPGNTRATGNASGNTESGGYPVKSDRPPAT